MCIKKTRMATLLDTGFCSLLISHITGLPLLLCTKSSVMQFEVAPVEMVAAVPVSSSKCV